MIATPCPASASGKQGVRRAAHEQMFGSTPARRKLALNILRTE